MDPPEPYPQKALHKLVVGYPRLAGQMETLPELAIFRRFGALNARNLLYMQAELAMLEEQLVAQEILDNNSDTADKKSYATDWYYLKDSSGDEEATQLNLVLEIRGKLKEYNEALFQLLNIHGAPPPDKWDLSDIQQYLQTPEMGPLALMGTDATIWGSMSGPKTYKPDLVALRPRRREDPFSGWFAERAANFIGCCGGSRWKKPSETNGEIGIQNTTIVRITLWFTTILASLIPLASIVVLYCVHSVPARLGVIGGFNLLVTTCLCAFTSAKRSEIFAVSAAFTAVQVVFVNSGTS